MTDPSSHEHHSARLSAPSISLHCYWESDATQAALDRIAQNRSFQAVRFEIRPGGIEKAIETYSAAPPPDMILLEHGEDFDGFLEKLGQLAECCEDPTEVIVVGDHDDVSSYRRLRHIGVNEYLLLPLEESDLLDALTTVFPDGSERKARFVSFVGARGGIGASILSQSVASIIATELNLGLTLVDLDVPFGTAALNLDLQDGPDALMDAAAAADRIDAVMLERLALRPWPNFEVLCNHTEDLDRHIDMEQLTDGLLPALQSYRELVLFDLPCRWAPWIERTLTMSDEIFLVVGPDLVSLRNTKLLMRRLKKLRPNDPAPKLILNGAHARHTSVVSDTQFKEALHCDFFAVIDSDPKAFTTAANEGRLLRDVGMRHATGAALDAMARLASGYRTDPSVDHGLTASLRRLVGK